MQAPDREVAGQAVDHHHVRSLADPLAVDPDPAAQERLIPHTPVRAALDHGRLLSGLQGHAFVLTFGAAGGWAAVRRGGLLDLLGPEDLDRHPAVHVVGGRQAHQCSTSGATSTIESAPVLLPGRMPTPRDEDAVGAVVPVGLLAARHERVGGQDREPGRRRPARARGPARSPRTARRRRPRGSTPRRAAGRRGRRTSRSAAAISMAVPRRVSSGSGSSVSGRRPTTLMPWLLGVAAYASVRDQSSACTCRVISAKLNLGAVARRGAVATLRPVQEAAALEPGVDVEDVAGRPGSRGPTRAPRRRRGRRAPRARR